MSIHVLEAGDEEYDHTYHDDIESFFYVFLWICCNWEQLRVVRKERRLKEWMQGPLKTIAKMKRATVNQGSEMFKMDVLEQFSKLWHSDSARFVVYRS